MNTPFQFWTTKESNILSKHYFARGAAALSRTLLPNFSPAQIASRASYMGLSFNPALIGRHSRNTEDLNHLINVQTPFVSYMLGFLWADGTIGKSTFYVALKIVENDFLDIKDLWLSTAKSWRYRVHHYDNPNHRPLAIVELNHQLFHQFLVQYGYIFKTGESAKDILTMIPDKLRHYWWRGYFDGDGGFTQHKRTRRISITSCYDQDWSFFHNLAQEMGLHYRISCGHCKNSSHSSVLIENEANLRRFMDYIYRGESFGLKRKHQSYLDYIEYKRTIRSSKTSRYRGVCWNTAKQKWMMQIYHGVHHRQYCSTEREAAILYDEKAHELFGNKAVLNFPST